LEIESQLESNREPSPAGAGRLRSGAPGAGPIRHALLVHGAGGGGWEWNIWKRIFQVHGFMGHAPDLLPSANGLRDTSLEDYCR